MECTQNKTFVMDQLKLQMSQVAGSMVWYVVVPLVMWQKFKDFTVSTVQVTATVQPAGSSTCWFWQTFSTTSHVFVDQAVGLNHGTRWRMKTTISGPQPSPAQPILSHPALIASQTTHSHDGYVGGSQPRFSEDHGPFTTWKGGRSMIP